MQGNFDSMNYRRIMNVGGRVITFGYHSVSMGKRRGFTQERILLMSHGGAIHDTIAVVEAWNMIIPDTLVDK